jgi:peptidyl-prolyl cis-trans isomerase D
MLKKLRHKKTAKRIWIILTILILPAFLFWGFGSFLRNKEEAPYAGKLFGRTVSLLEYQDTLEAVRNQMIIQFGDNISEIEKKIDLDSLAWDRLILLREAKKLKVKATDNEIIELIQSYPFLKTKNGQFNNQVYSSMLRYVFHTQARIFEEQVRQSIMLSKLYKQLTANINLTDQEIKNEYQKLNEQVSINYIASIPSDFAKDITPPKEQISDYFAKNSFEFKQPLSFNAEYISMTAKDKDDIPAKESIKKMYSRLARKDDFGKLAKESNLELKETGLFSQADPIPGIGWSPQIFVLISKLKPGELAPPIYLDKHYYILRLKERKETYIPDFEAIKDKVKDVFIKDASRKIAQKKIEDCIAELQAEYKANTKSVDFNKAAKALGLKSDSTGLFKYGSYIEGIGASDSFFNITLGLKEDAFSGIIEMPSGFYVIKLKSRVPFDEKKFQEDKPEFSKKLLLQKKEDYFTSFLLDLKNKAQLSGS